MLVHVQSSPLRYPGGKQAIQGLLASVIEANGLEGSVYAEPYAGGGGAALSLLFSEHVQQIRLNDADSCIAAFWESILSNTEDFLRLLRDTPISIAEWKKQQLIYSQSSRFSRLRVGFATFYLNRTNRSGIIKNGGPIGGVKQLGQWKIDARFNRTELVRRISRIALYKERIKITRLDAIRFMADSLEPAAASGQKLFVYLDPPYYAKGNELYLNYYSPADHQQLAQYILAQRSFKWLLTYDHTPEISSLYSGIRQFSFNLSYSAHTRKKGRELLILGPDLNLPDGWRQAIPSTHKSSPSVVRRRPKGNGHQDSS